MKLINSDNQEIPFNQKGDTVYFRGDAPTTPYGALFSLDENSNPFLTDWEIMRMEEKKRKGAQKKPRHIGRKGRNLSKNTLKRLGLITRIGNMRYNHQMQFDIINGKMYRRKETRITTDLREFFKEDGDSVWVNKY